MEIKDPRAAPGAGSGASINGIGAGSVDTGANGVANTVDLAPNISPLALGDIQGLILRGYNYPYIRYFILRIRDSEEAIKHTREFCRSLLPGASGPLTITSATDWGAQRPAYCLNIGLTSSGLKKLIGADQYKAVNNATTSDLFQPFDIGAADPSTSAKVGDIGASSPKHWWKNGGWQPPTQPSTEQLDILLALYLRAPEDPDDPESFAATLLGMIPKCVDEEPAAQAVFIQQSDPLPDAQGNPTNQIHFGYEDGISQPRIAGAPGESVNAPDDNPWVEAWHFVITKKAPLYHAAPLLVNGSFGAFRLLYQDVGAFNKFIGQAKDPALLAAKMCGRWFDGSPLEVTPDKPDPSLQGFDLTNFNYLHPTPHQKGPRLRDGAGLFCPYAAHTRRVNPRDDTEVSFNTDNAALHRVRRFARSYGPAYTPETADAQRGLVGLFMGANLGGQFEFIMQTWIGQGGFRPGNDHSPNQSGVDPFFGPQANDQNPYDRQFDYCTTAPAIYETVTGMESFIRTDGGLYVFLPGLAALGAISQGILPPG